MSAYLILLFLVLALTGMVIALRQPARKPVPAGEAQA